MGSGSDSNVTIANIISDTNDVNINVELNAGPNPEIGLSTTSAKSRIPLPLGDPAKIRVRLVLMNDGSNYIAKLFVGFDNNTGRTETISILQQTTYGSSYSGSLNTFRIGNISGSTYSITYSKISILNASDPDVYYKVPLINNVIPSEGELAGGDKIVILGSDLDNKIVDVDFSDLTWISDLSQDGGNISVASNKLELNLLSGGNPNIRGIARFGFPLASDFIGGSDLTFDIEFNNLLLTNKPSFEVILFAAEIRIGTTSFIIEFVTSTSIGSIIRIFNKSGYDVIGLTAGTILFQQELEDIDKNEYTVRIILIGSVAYLYLDGAFKFKNGIDSGPAVINIYNKSSQPIDLTTYISNLILRPVVTIGNNIVLDFLSADNNFLSFSLPEGSNIGNFPIVIRGINADLESSFNVNYLQPSQELRVAQTRDLGLYLTHPILKQRL
jgi:hypothetical protein